MNNQIAAECCGSCGWYCWNSRLSKYNCHNSEIVKQHKQDDFIPESLCVPNYYSPRNPIPITDLPGIKELVEQRAVLLEACHAVLEKGLFPGEILVPGIKEQLKNAIAGYRKDFERIGG